MGAPMKNRFAMLLAVAFLAPPMLRQASQMKLSDLMDICTAGDDGSTSACRFYILGVTEGASIGAGVANDQSHFCIPEGVSSRDMVLTVKKAMPKDLAAFPQDKDMPAVSFVAAVMMRTFPCKK
jgi:Rap1a immunity proteins